MIDNIKIIPLLDTLRLQKIDDSEYFSKKYSGYISNSRLSLINPKQDGSPEKFFNGFTFTYSPAFQIGSAVHELILQSDLFYLVDSVDKPTAKLGAIADELYPIFKEKNIKDEDIINAAVKIDYYGGNLNQNKIDNVLNSCTPYWTSRKQFESTYSENKELIYLDKKSREIVCNCVNALKSNKNIQNLLHPSSIIYEPISENEQAILLDVEVEMPNGNNFILSLKAKLDNYTVDFDTNTVIVNDVKTTFDIIPNFNLAIQRFHYYREMAIYCWLLSLCVKKFYNLDKFTIKSNFLVVQTKSNYYTKVIPMTKKLFSNGFNEFKYLLDLVVENFKFYPESSIFIKQ